MIIRRAFLAAALATWVWAGPALAAPGCPAAYPLSSAAWKQFEAFVEKEYGKSNASKAIVMGHALGRVAAANGNDPARGQVVECLMRAINHYVFVGQVKVTAILGSRYWNTFKIQHAAIKVYNDIIEAAMGMRDAEVARVTGVRTTSPAEGYFARLGMGAPRGKSPGRVLAQAGFEQGINLPGGDYRHFALDRPDPSACHQACLGDRRCRAWTYVKPGVQGRKAHCWLKNVVPVDARDGCCVSGVMAGRGSSGSAPGAKKPKARTAKKHPWEGLCYQDILKRGYRPIFSVSSTMFSAAHIFADPVSNQYVSVTGCTKRPWDMQAFQRDFREMDTKYYKFSENQTYFKSVGYKHRQKNEWVSLNYYRR